MENSDKASDVFVSYSHINKDVADAVVHCLESADIKCWYASRDIKPGDIWEKAIIRAIKASRVFVLIFSKDSNSSKQVSNELTVAFNAECIIIPLRIEECKMSEKFEYYLSSVHWLDALTPPVGTRISKLRDRILSILRKSSDANEDIKPSVPTEKKPQTEDVPQEILNEAADIYHSTRNMSNSGDILEAADKIKALLEKYNTPEIAERYAAALCNATVRMTDSGDILEAADKIIALLEKYNTPEIARQYAMALVNATIEMTDSGDILKVADKIKVLLEKHNTPEIAKQYAMALYNAANKMTKSGDRLEAADKIKVLLETYNTPEIAKQYAAALYNTTVKMTRSGDRLEVSKTIKTLLDKYDAPIIAVYYIALNYSCHIMVKTDEQKQQIISDVHKAAERYSKAELIKAAEDYEYGIMAISKLIK